MSDTEEEKIFCIERAKQGRAACKKCKEKCPTGELRLAKLVSNPFGDGGKMKTWHHIDCMFELFLKQRAATKRIQSEDDIDGWDALSEEDKTEVRSKIEESEKTIAQKYGLKTPSKKASPSKKATPVKKEPSSSQASTSKAAPEKNDPLSSQAATPKVTPVADKEGHRDTLFREFRRLVAEISNVSSYLDKTNLVKTLFEKGSDGTGFKGDVAQWVRLLLPGVVQRIYNLQSKQLIKLFSRIFDTSQSKMLDHLNSNDIGETIQKYFEKSKKLKPSKKSTVTMQEVDDFLDELSHLTKEEEQTSHFEAIVRRCTGNDLKSIIRLIKHDLRMNAGAKHILEAVHPNAYQAYQASRNINAVVSRFLSGEDTSSQEESKKKADINLMTPVQPMLAEACKSVEKAMKKCPNGMYAEIKYDGERVQLHKQGSVFKYFSRSLKPVLPHKVSHFKDSIPEAFPHAKDLILDSEILMIDTVTGKPLPFGSLGKHKKNEFQDANVCLFVFDCIYYNGESLVHKPLEYRKKVLKENMQEISNRVMFSELKVIRQPKELNSMIAKVLEMGLEGLVLKDLQSIYAPGKRHWLKVKKDYLHDGAIADTADLIVLGAWYGTGKKAGMKSVFLMGCYDEATRQFCTVTKVHTGHDDKTLEALQKELKMEEINCNVAKVPVWLNCARSMIPDFVAEDPRKQPVWEITGAEFTQHDVHTADGISIRFPRVTMIRSDKDWKSATNLEELKQLYRTSKENTDFSSLLGVVGSPSSENEEQKTPVSEGDKKPKSSPKRKHEPELADERETKKKKIDATAAKPSTSSNSNFLGNVKVVDPLPLIFEQVQLLLEKDAEDKYAEWLRYFVAYGGTVLKSKQWKKATHVLHVSNAVPEPTITALKEARHVSIDWIKDSVINEELQHFKHYTVTLDPL